VSYFEINENTYIRNFIIHIHTYVGTIHILYVLYVYVPDHLFVFKYAITSTDPI